MGRKKETMLTVTVQSVNWPAEREDFLEFREFLEAHGCKWQEGMGAHLVTFPKVKR